MTAHAATKARPTLILGSSSPRRRELLSLVGLRYEVIKPEVEEAPRVGESPEAYVLRNAREKGAWVAERIACLDVYTQGAIVISADTIVVLDDDILEKPRDRGHAAEMLRRLAGREHTVISGVGMQAVRPGVVQSSPGVVFAVSTKVRLKPLSEREIAAYIRTGEPLDKAGAYAAQGIGSYMVERIEGSYANVVGLPIAEVTTRLERDFSYSLFED